MRSEIKHLKFMAKIKVLCIGTLLMFGAVTAQEKIIDSTNVIQEPVLVLQDSVMPEKTFTRFKAEGVSAVVGEYVVLDSDIDKSYLEMQQQGVSIKDITRCQLLGKLMEDKLYAHHAKVDSLVVSDEEITGRIEQQIAYITDQFGGDEAKVAEFYKKSSIEELRQELFETNKVIYLAGQMQQKVVENVEVTPEEVRQFYFDIPEDQRPVFSAEVEVAQIIIEPVITEKAKQDVIDKLNEFRRDIVEKWFKLCHKSRFILQRWFGL